MGRIMISEYFHSLQGEGRFVGTPSFFIRTTGCNLRCIWCDTRYSWKSSGVVFSEEELLRLIQSELRERENLVLTGGEPLIWWENLRNILEVLDGKVVEIETNGTIYPDGIESIGAYLNVSFKLASSGMERRLRVCGDVLKRLNNYDRTMFKVVISDMEDLMELVGIVNEYGLDWGKVIVMPNYCRCGCLERFKWLWDWCIENGIRFSGRLHVDVGGK